MKNKDRIICCVCIFLAIAALIAAGMQLDFINSQRYKMRLISNEPLENAPPSLAFATVAMGAFRGLVVDVLWIRADKLKQEGQFFDAKQLAEWITTLQPRFAEVWEFQAWNMAYNISVAIPATQPDQRWQWVKNGYELIRDQGIELNPKSILLYQELARIFQNKIGGISDDAHKYYKLQLAWAMGPLLGSADSQYFKVLAEAPTDFKQIIKDANVAGFVKALNSAEPNGFSASATVGNGGETFVNNYLSLRQNPRRFSPAAFEVINDFRGTQTLEKFDIFAKAHNLRKTWKLDPVLMQELNKTYGPINWDDTNEHLPLDWRHPDSHAIYWAVKGLRIAGRPEYSGDEANTDRIVNNSLQDLFRNGKIFIYKSSGQSESNTQNVNYEIFLRPDLRMFESYNKCRLAAIEKYKGERKGTYESLKIGHRNMLKNAVFSFYQAGHIRQAEKIYNQLRQLYPREEFNVPLAVYARNRLIEEIRSLGINDAKEIIQMLLRESYFRYAMRDDDDAFSKEKMAKEIYDHYKTLYSDENSQKRINLPDFKLLRYLALVDFISDGQYPSDLRRNLLGRIKNERPKLAEQLRHLETELNKQQQKTSEETK